MTVVSLSLCFIWLLHCSTSAATPMRESLLPVHWLNLTDTTLVLPPRNDTLNGQLKNATGSTSARFDTIKRERRINSEQLRDGPLHNRVIRSSGTSPLLQVDSWNNRLKQATAGLVNKIPKVGWLVSALVDLFWPSSKADIWTMIKDQVKDLVDAAILKRELEDRQHDISGLQQTLNMYANARNREKGGIMATLIGLMNQLFFKLTNSSNSHHFIPLTCTAAHMHLTLLLERQTYGNEIYEENNTLTWTRELTEQHNTYKRFFTEVFQRWKEWRSSVITTKWSWYSRFDIIPPFFTFVSYGETHDSKTGEKIYYSKDRTWVGTLYQETMLAIKLRMTRQAAADMIQKTLSTTFNINAYLPGQAMAAPVVPPDFETFVMGPYSATTVGRAQTEYAKSDLATTDISDTNYAKITQIKVRENHIVDMLQFIYANGDGKIMGNPTGGFPHTIVPRPGAHFTGLKMAFDYEIMLAVEVYMSDNTTSGMLGNRRVHEYNWPDDSKKVAAVVDPSYEMTGINCKTGRDRNGNVGVPVIELVFRYSTHVQ